MGQRRDRRGKAFLKEGAKERRKICLQKEAFPGLNQWPGKACLEEGIMERTKKEPVRL